MKIDDLQLGKKSKGQSSLGDMNFDRPCGTVGDAFVYGPVGAGFNFHLATTFVHMNMIVGFGSGYFSVSEYVYICI